MSIGSVIKGLFTSAKGTTAAGSVTSANIDANTQALHANLVAGTANVGSFNVASGGTAIGTRPDGFMKASIDPSTLLLDTHDSALDTTNTWTLGGTITPIWSAGAVSFPPGTAASASSYMYTKFATPQSASSYVLFASVHTLDAAAITGNKRFWGLGVFAATPTIAVPLINGSVFEISDADGALYAVTYSNSVRITALPLTRATDGGPHRYAIYHKTSKLYFEIDNVLVATINNPNLQGSVFSGLAGSINGGTALTTAATLAQSVMSLADPGRNNTKVSDGIFPWRTAKVSNAGELLVNMTSALPTGVNAIGSVVVTSVPTTPVVGTFFQATQPVSGTFFQATQPVSLATNTPVIAAGTAIIGKVGIDQSTPGTTNGVSVTNTSLAVTGTFFQTTQPVSQVGAWSMTISTPIKGTTAAGNPTSETTDANTQSLHTRITNASLAVTGTFFQATQPVSLATNTPVIAAGANNIGSVNLATSGTALGARADGFLRSQIDPVTLLFDTFEILDTTNTWTLGGTAVPTGAGGLLSVAAGTAASATSYAVSKPAFTQGASAYLQFAALISFETAAIAGNQRFWGIGVITTPTLTVPITNGTVFELDNVAGALIASVYSNGVRTLTTTLTRPTDGLTHRYAIYYKASRVYFELDNVTVSSLAFPNPAISALNVLIGSINGGTALTTAATLNSSLLGLADTGRNATQMADGTYPWRKVQVGTSGGLSVKGAPVFGVTTSIAAASTGTIGPVAVGEAGNCTFTIKNTVAANAYAGNPVIVFEQSDDNVSWGPLGVTRSDTQATASTFTLVPNTANTSLMFDTALEGTNWIRARVTTGPVTNALTVVIAAGTLPFSPSVSIGNSVNIQPVQAVGVNGTITTATSIVATNATNQSIVSVVISGTYAGVSLSFEATMDNVNWFVVTGTYSGNGSSTAGFFGISNALQNADVPLYGYIGFRIRATAYTSGTANITLITKAISASPFIASISQGTVANGSATFANPLLMGGTDGTNARSVFVKAASVAAVATDPAMVVSLSPNSPVVQAAITKGTQGIAGVTTQDLKDAGRVAKMFTTDGFVVGATTETLAPMNTSTDLGAITTINTYTVTAGKRLRLQQFTVGSYTVTGSTTAVYITVRLHASPSGTLASVATATQITVVVPTAAGVNQSSTPISVPLPDGFELGPGASICIGVQCLGFVATTAAPRAMFSLSGYEY